VTIDYNARKFKYVETLRHDFLEGLLEKTVLIFQLNADGGK
jgi:hypothetical protein